ncbi:MAG: hypothetical protein LBU32_12775 [Clostridiales bacterium]|nr:hypothetical protein [Clostridiales bacterium]
MAFPALAFLFVKAAVEQFVKRNVSFAESENAFLPVKSEGLRTSGHTEVRFRVDEDSYVLVVRHFADRYNAPGNRGNVNAAERPVLRFAAELVQIGYTADGTIRPRCHIHDNRFLDSLVANHQRIITAIDDTHELAVLAEFQKSGF